jgi:hypothetical protein
MCLASLAFNTCTSYFFDFSYTHIYYLFDIWYMYILRFDTQSTYAVPIWHVMHIYITYLTLDTHIYHLFDIWHICKLLIWHSIYICGTYLACNAYIYYLFDIWYTHISLIWHLVYIHTTYLTLNIHMRLPIWHVISKFDIW